MNRTGVIYMSEKVPSISEAEWEVMNVLWEKAPQTANDVISNLQGQKRLEIKNSTDAFRPISAQRCCWCK